VGKWQDTGTYVESCLRHRDSKIDNGQRLSSLGARARDTEDQAQGHAAHHRQSNRHWFSILFDAGLSDGEESAGE